MSTTHDAVARFAVELRTPDVATYARVVGGDDAAYTSQWPEWQWRNAATIYAAFPDDAIPGRAYELLPNPVMPEWLRRTISGRASLTIEGMAPAYCWLSAETLDWFTLADDHADVLNPPAAYGRPADVTTPAALRQAWQSAHVHGSAPVLKIELAPAGTEDQPRIDVTVEGFYLVTPDNADHDETVEQVASLLGFAGEPEPRQFLNTDNVAVSAGIAPGRVHAWEWI
jgi:hypothetical protein